YFRSHFPTGYTWLEEVGMRHPIGFGWYMLAHTQHNTLAIIQISDVTGAYGVSFLVALVNAVVWLNIERVPAVRTWLRNAQLQTPFSLRPAVVAQGLLALAVAYGIIRLDHAELPRGPEVALIQGNLPQDVKNEHGDEMADHFIRLADEAV